MAKKFDIYEAITARILADLEKGELPWHKPWVAGALSFTTTTRTKTHRPVDPTRMAYSRSTGRPYSLLNQMLLSKPGEYATYKQITEAGGQVKKGAKAQMVVFWKQITIKEMNPDTNVEEEKTIPVLKYFNVFHTADDTTLEPRKPREFKTKEEVHIPVAAEQKWDDFDRAEAVATAYLAAQGIDLDHVVGDRAFYRPATDSITLPAKAQFKSQAGYYGTLYHEMVHSTGHPDRLNRLVKIAAKGDGNYSQEELCAEIGAAAALAEFGIDTEDERAQNVAYIQSWLKALKNDKKMVVMASGRAEKALNLIFETEPENEPDPEEPTEEPAPEKGGEAVEEPAEPTTANPAECPAVKAKKPTISAKWNGEDPDCLGLNVTIKNATREDALNAFEVFALAFAQVWGYQYDCAPVVEELGGCHMLEYVFHRERGETAEIKEEAMRAYKAAKNLAATSWDDLERIVKLFSEPAETTTEYNCPALESRLKCRATKTEMVETIREAEANAWLRLAEYKHRNVPVCGDLEWRCRDVFYQRMLSAWDVLNFLCEDLGIATGETWQYEKASALSKDTFLRQQACEGIYYSPDEILASATKMYRDTESGCTISEAELLREWGMQPAADRTLGETFAEYLANCLSKNGFLEEVN